MGDMLTKKFEEMGIKVVDVTPNREKRKAKLERRARVLKARKLNEDKQKKLKDRRSKRERGIITPKDPTRRNPKRR